MAIMTIGRLLLRPASGFTVGIEVEADIDFFCFIVTPDEAVSRIIVVAKREFDDQHLVVVSILDDQIVNAWGPVFDIPERELDTRSIACAITEFGSLRIGHQGRICSIEGGIETF